MIRHEERFYVSLQSCNMSDAYQTSTEKRFYLSKFLHKRTAISRYEFFFAKLSVNNIPNVGYRLCAAAASSCSWAAKWFVWVCVIPVFMSRIETRQPHAAVDQRCSSALDRSPWTLHVHLLPLCLCSTLSKKIRNRKLRWWIKESYRQRI
jgi:hypothetical protein